MTCYAVIDTNILVSALLSSHNDAATVLVIEKFGERVIPSPTGELLLDMKDLPFYEVVIETQGKDAYLVTGNIKHFPTKPFIVTAKEFLDILKTAK